MDKKVIVAVCLVLLVGAVVFVGANKNWFYRVGSDYQVTVQIEKGWNLVHKIQGKKVVKW